MATRLYRLLLRAYPAALRRDHGDEMTSAFDARWREPRTLVGRVSLVAALLLDFITSLPREWRGRPAPTLRHAALHGRTSPMTGIFADARQALGLFRAAPGLAAGAVLTLGFGIGATTAIVALADATLLRPLAIEAPDRIVYSEFSWSHPDFRDLEGASTGFSAVAGWSGFDVSLGRTNDATTVEALGVSGGYFGMVGIQPVAGRFLIPSDDVVGAPLAAVISERLWRRELGGHLSAIGESIRINGQEATVIGVAPASFRGLSLRDAPEVFVAAAAVPRVATGFLASPRNMTSRGRAWLQVAGRMASGVGMEQVRAEVEAVYRQAHPPDQTAPPPEPLRLIPLLERATGLDTGDDIRRFIAVLVGAAVTTLLLACATVACLLLVRTEARRRELTLRAALGASHQRLARLLLAESLMIGIGGIAVGVGAAIVMIGWLGSFNLPGNIPIADLRIGVDARLFGVAAAAGLLTSLIFGLAPMWRASRTSAASALNEGARGSTGRSARGLLVGAQVATCVVLVGGSLAFARAVSDAWSIDLGFDVSRAGLVSVRSALTGETRAEVTISQARILDATRKVPGVEAAAWSALRPFRGSMTMQVYGPDPSGAPGHQDVAINVIGPDYFRALGLTVLEGREFETGDATRADGVAIVSKSLADRHWPGQSAIGRQVSSDAPSPANTSGMTVVGVVSDLRRQLSAPAAPTVYMPLGQQPDLFGLGGNYLIVRAAGGQSPAAAVARAARAASSAAPSTPVAWAHTFEDEFRSTIMAQRLGLLLFRLFAALALLLTGLGLFAVFAFAVTQRTREIGIRVALGSSRASVVALVARQAAAPLLSGLVAGGTLLFLAAPALERFLFAAPAAAQDRVVLLILTIVALAAAATWIPTRRALAIEPVTALRE